MLTGRKEILEPGKRSKVLRLFSDSIPRRIEFDALPVPPSQHVSGVVEIERWQWFFRKPKEKVPLERFNSLKKGFGDVDYAVYVTPDTKVEIRFHSRQLEAKALLGILVLIVVLAAVSATLIPILGGN